MMGSKLESLKLRLPDAKNDALLLSLLEEAEAAVLAMCAREVLPTVLIPTVVKLAAIAYNRMGMEGESSHSEGGVSASIDAMPDNIRREIAPWRLAVTK